MIDIYGLKHIAMAGSEKRYPITQETTVDIDTEIRIVLIGRTGSGKSSTGNTVMKEKYFRSEASVSSVTSTCNIGKAKRKKHILKIVDTPGFFDTNLSTESVKLEILKCLNMLSPGPNIIMYVLRVGRFTEEEIKAVQHFLHLFGGDPFRYTIIVITGRDDLEQDGTTPSQFLENIPEYFREFLSKCRDRVVFLNNRSKIDSERQFEEMLPMIEKMILENADTSSFYTNEILEEIKSGIYKSSLDRLIGFGANSMFQKYKRFSGYLMIVVGAGLIVGSRHHVLGIVCIGVGYILTKIKSTTPESKLAKVVRQLERNNSPCIIS
ncbi:GTPase IMAP family member 9-like isoform X1 [Mytilus californianus]|uniref:GTPase IMAP family member 9-like isoform X1 n=1 Tax=Mytilus californianus TaxID=6549 RepID=UPI00224689BD|nr:GTPase IMAP family member 9-like isoform X1 [Mytilus californianus]